MSIRLRLTLWYSTIFAIGLASFAVIVWFSLHGVLHQDIDAWLGLQSEGFERFVLEELLATDEEGVVEEAREFSTGMPSGSGIQLFNAQGKLILSRPEVSKELAPRPAGETMVHDDAVIRAIGGRFSVSNSEYRYVLWRSLAETEKALNLLALVLFALTPVFLVLSIAGGWWLAQRALRPVDEITQAARRISLRNMSGSLPVPPHRDELRRLCEAWNEMLGRLDVSAKRLTQFTEDASHELRTPVALIRTTAEVAMRQERSAEEYLDAIRKIAHDSQDMSQILDDLMELARADNKAATFTFAPMDLGELLSEVGEEVRPLINKRQLEFAVSAPRSKSIVGDRAAIRRLLLLFLDNATKFTSPPGRVELNAEIIGDEIILEVRDTGIGIGEQDLPYVFDRFYQADRSRSSGGSGLGLSITQWIVESYKGRIEVRSVVGQGSTFRIFLPLHPGRA